MDKVFVIAAEDILPLIAIGPQTFTLYDGIHPGVTFQFVGNASDPSGANIRIELSDQQDVRAVRDAVRNAINNAEDSLPHALRVTATAQSGIDSMVVLTQDFYIDWNGRVIDVAVDNGNFSSIHVTNGVGGECSDGETCQNDKDCWSNDCKDNRCNPR